MTYVFRPDIDWILAAWDDIFWVGGVPVALPQSPGPCRWLISGIHGDEPAGPMALAETQPPFSLVIPVMDPEAYELETRFGTKRRSVWRERKEELKQLISLLAVPYPPTAFIDLHEDDTIPPNRAYAYVYPFTWEDRVREFLSTLPDVEPLNDSIMVRPGEEVLDGVAPQGIDGSIDAYMMAKFPNIPVVVFETSSQNRLEDRVRLQSAFLEWVQRSAA